MQQRLALREPDPEERVAAVMAAHGRTLLRVAHHWSLCHDDALDAYQRGLEIFLRRAAAVDPATEVAWLKVVIKHEALAIRRARSDAVSGEEPDLDAVAPAAQRPIEDQVAGGERVSRSAEALRSLKPDEAQALMLKAEGLSYAEIGERCGWTYTKVNRAITEGRRRFMEVYAAIEAGDECDRFAPVLAALAEGTASSAQIVEIRPHLRHCIACRATVRELHMSRSQRLRLLLPVFALSPFTRGLDSPGGSIRTPEEILRAAPHIELPPEASAPPLPDAATVLELGGRLTLSDRLRPGRIKEEAVGLLHRANPSDVATGIHIATSGAGGGRIATIATIIGFCVSGVGAGALCVATGVVHAPRLFAGSADEGKRVEPRAAAKPSKPARADASTRWDEHVPIATPPPTPPPPPAPVASPRKPRRDPAPRNTGPSSHESAPILATSGARASEFSPEQSAPQTSPPPAPAPETGGGEFMP